MFIYYKDKYGLVCPNSSDNFSVQKLQIPWLDNITRTVSLLIHFKLNFISLALSVVWLPMGKTWATNKENDTQPMQSTKNYLIWPNAHQEPHNKAGSQSP